MTEEAEIKSLAEHFTGAPSIFTTSPLYRSLCPAVARDRPLLELLTERRTGQQASYLLFGAVHYLLLDGTDHPLRRFYPSLAGPDAADPGDAGPTFLDFCRTHRPELSDLIRTRLVQTNVVKRAIGLKIAMSVIQRSCARPVHLIEVGASAGIHLHFDRYRYIIGGRVSGPADAPVTVTTHWRGTGPAPDYDDIPPIASRTGVDLHPVDATDPRERQWLRALVWPENQREADLLSAALKTVTQRPVDVIAGDAIEVCPELGERLPAGEPRVVFHAATRMHVPPDRRAAFDQAIDSIGAHGPLYHVWQEPPSAQHHGTRPDDRGVLALHGPGGIEPVPLTRIDGHLDWIAPLTAR